MRLAITSLFLLSTVTLAQTAPTTQPAGVGKFPGVEVDLPKHEVRVECETLNPQMPIEFFCVLNGTSEHESVLRTAARPMHIHTALLMLGLRAGQCAQYSNADKKWHPPTGAPLEFFVETTRDGQPVREPAYTWFRDVKTHQPPKSFAWVFCGSKVMPDGNYAADTTGYVATVVNFDLSLIDVPQIASSANETLEWEYNPEKVPPKGTKVTMVIRPAKQGDAAESQNPKSEPGGR